MIKPSDFWLIFKKNGFSFFSGVPCSILSKVLADVPVGITYFSATKEDNALGVVSGAYLAGKKGAILIQNSGLGNIINGLTSFNLIYKIPVLLVITWRGEPGRPDAPEHFVMGKVMLPILKTLGIPYKIINDNFSKQLVWADELMKKNKKPIALILKEGVIK